jgi:hypothetical protein
MRGSILLACVAVVGCASGNVVQQASPPVETIRVGGAGALSGATMTMSTVHDVNPNGGTVPFAIDPVWAALRMVYDSLGIAVATFDPKNHLIGNPTVKLRRRLGNTSLSKYIDCGNTQGAPSADTYEVILSVLTTARSDKEGTTVLTTVEAQGRPITLSGDYTRCSTTSALEAKIVGMVNAALKR